RNLMLLSVVTVMFTACSDETKSRESIDGTLVKGEFTVARGKKVYFSQGNLQYQASTNTWRFAEHQYDMVGADNLNISSSYSGWIDLFGWGTSGWNSGANAYQPYSTSTSDNDYYPGSSYTNNLTGNYANADWGVYNKISNGGNQAGLWRTLTNDEWDYLINKRANASIKMGVASVNGVNGLILLPDNWTLPDSIVFTNGVAKENSSEYSHATVNSYTANEWSKMESNGAVFFPAAGYCTTTGMGGIGYLGSSWSSTANGSHDAYFLFFESRVVEMGSDNRKYRTSVRLVRDAE
ncbi:MAG: hypothetical protein K5860_10510, partial [Bacteroidales bacterium]|nr:hypothetical protein [Bacteroidales bacterium]